MDKFRGTSGDRIFSTEEIDSESVDEPVIKMKIGRAGERTRVRVYQRFPPPPTPASIINPRGSRDKGIALVFHEIKGEAVIARS